MDESLDTVFYTGESSKWRDPGDFTRDDLARCIALFYRCPGVHTGTFVSCSCHRMGSILRCQLQQEAADMFLDCRERDHQLPGDLLVGGPLREQTQDLLFALGEWLQELLCSLRGRGGS